MWHDMHGYYWGWGSWIFGMLFLIFLIWLIVKIVVGKTNNADTTGAALNILNERYARGEIDKDEYLERKKVLTQKA